eukprot:5612097-Amphidinium_carterae.1
MHSATQQLRTWTKGEQHTLGQIILSNAATGHVGVALALQLSKLLCTFCVLECVDTPSFSFRLVLMECQSAWIQQS